MSLGAFLQDDNYGGSWADEVEEVVGSQPLPPATHGRSGPSGYSSYGGFERSERSYAPRDSFPTELPTRPPYTAHLGNLSYDATTETVTEFLEGCDVTSVRIIEDRIEQRPKGFAYAEFKDVEGLKQALTLDGQTFQGRSIRIKIADPPKDRNDRADREGSARDLSSWDRKGPLPDLPGRNDRRDFSERRGPPRDGPIDDGKSRDFGNWERRGPLSPLPQAEGSASRESSRPRNNDARRTDSFRGDRRTSPATWGEGRQEGSRPPRGEFRERPERPERPERVPTAAELDNQWRSNMRPDRQTPEQSAAPSEAPSPAGPAGRPRLNLAKRTVSEAPGVASPPPNSAADSKSNPFGAARPIDTATKEREIAEKQEQNAREKKEAEEQAKEERRLAKEAAAKEAEAQAEAAAKAAEEKANAPAAEVQDAASETQDAAGAASGEQKIPSRPREQVQNPRSRAAEAGNWRSASGETRTARGGYQNVPRGGRGESRGGRGDRGGRGGRFEGGRPPRANGNAPAPAAAQQETPATPTTPSAPEAPADPEGWTTVPAKGRRNQSTRA
ncbi:hypothetical protein PFICI_12945 [Pestalotiopsis fici W106-1]|uniref:RRM domain-containing protein n=1 Tax=Pestalotiopsis fici (strain W106-1 / CGMCC3.15140) TaxID=1229662 RepID=W3WT48_PESFW|nr:uncharacterized protein PFICI_12945 [Pestalotiopsis fici W106-1]ETS76001.1 hypothetical protein PFICI_12945 [Pestalotiopsis fici W106-1]